MRKMKIIWIVSEMRKKIVFYLFATALIMYAGSSFGFDECNNIISSKTESLASKVQQRVVYDVPMSLIHSALKIKFVDSSESSQLIPFAEVSSDGTKKIVFPSVFEVVSCQLVLAHYMENAGINNVWDKGILRAKRCFDNNGTRISCLIYFGNELEKSLRKSFSMLSKREKEVAYGIARDAIYQIGAHEISHHIYDHHKRVKSGELPRIDVEFEADLYALLWAINDGRVYFSLRYLFSALEIVFSLDPGYIDTSYESITCRLSNVEQVMDTLSLAPTIFGKVVQNRSNQDLDLLDDAISQLEETGSVERKLKQCNRMSEKVLVRAKEELLELMRTYHHHKSDFIKPVVENSSTFSSLPESASVEAVSAILNEVRKANITGIIASRTLSFIVQRSGHTNGLVLPSNLIGEIKKELSIKSSARNYGRFLNGLAAKYLSKLSQNKARIIAKNLYSESTKYLPDSADTWLNLSTISMHDRDCKAAVEYSNYALKYSTPGPPRELAKETYLSWVSAAVNRADLCETALSPSQARVALDRINKWGID